MNEGLVPSNGFVVFMSARHDGGFIPRRQGFGHVVLLVKDVHSPRGDRYLHYCCRPGLWRPTVLLTGEACKDESGEVFSLPDAIKAGMVDLDLNGRPDGGATILPWQFPDRPTWRPWFIWRRTATGQAKHLMGVKAPLVRTPAGLHAWMTAPVAERRVTPWKFVRGLFWFCWQMLVWALSSGKRQGA